MPFNFAVAAPPTPPILVELVSTLSSNWAVEPAISTLTSASGFEFPTLPVTLPEPKNLNLPPPPPTLESTSPVIILPLLSSAIEPMCAKSIFVAVTC